VIVIEVDWTHNVLQVEYVLPWHLHRPPLDILVIVLSPQLLIIVLLVKHILNEEGVEEVRASPARLPLAHLLVAPCEANPQEVIYYLIVEPLART